MEPTIEEVETKVGRAPEGTWTHARTPFLYYPNENKIFMGSQSSHHGNIYDAIGRPWGGDPKDYPAMGMMFNYPTDDADYGAYHWWNNPPENREEIENHLRKVYPHTNWDADITHDVPAWEDEEDWSTHIGSLNLLNDNVMHIPGMFHKGILYNHPAGFDSLHIWPLEHDSQWGPDPDAHPYHDEYARDNKMQLPYGAGFDNSEAQTRQTRIYVDPKGQIRGYPTRGTFQNHAPEYITQRVQEHIPHAQWTNAPQDLGPSASEPSLWESHTLPPTHILGAAKPVTVEHVPGEPKYFHSHDYPYLYHTLTRRLFTGELGAYHADMDKDHPAIKQYRDWEEGYSSPYEWLRGRYDEHDVEHYDQYGLAGRPNDRKLLQPHFEAINSVLGTQEPETPEEDWTSHTLGSAIPYPTTGELHIALGVPERIRLQIARWVESLALPRDSLVNPNEYHITLAYADEGVEKVQAHEIKNNFNLTGLKFTGKALASFDGDALVIELENEYYSEWADHLADYLEDKGVDVERYDGGPKPHITIAYGVSKSALLPPISFRCEGVSISTPRSAPQGALGPYTARHTVASPPATPPPRAPGTWGKGLFIDHPELGQQLSTWTTGTKSLNGGTPHHNQVAEGHHGIAWGDMIDMMRAKQCYLLQIEPDGKTYECAMGHTLPPSFEALGAQQGLYQPAPYVDKDEDDWTP